MWRAAGRSPANPWLGSLLALAVTLAVAIGSVVPASVADAFPVLGARLGLAPHLALAPIFVWLIDRDGAAAGPVAAFLAGLVVDALTSSPLGVCAAAYLGFHAIAAREAKILGDFPFAARLVAFGLLAAGVVAVQIVAIVAVGGVRPSLEGAGLTLAATVAAYPPALAVMGGGRRGRRRPALKGLEG